MPTPNIYIYILLYSYRDSDKEKHITPESVNRILTEARDAEDEGKEEKML